MKIMTHLARCAPAFIHIRIIAAGTRVHGCYQNEKICFNGELSGKQIRKYCVLTENAFQVAKNAFELMELSARSYHRILKVSRTIADMEGEELIHTRHVAEALTYKAFDKKYRS